MTPRNPFTRAVDVPKEVVRAASLGRGEKVLAGTVTADGSWLVGTRGALVVVPPVEGGGATQRVPWQQVERADWSRDDERLVVTEVGEYGQQRPRHVFAVPDPGVLLELVRERVTASVVHQRRVLTEGKRGLLVIARRAPSGDGDLTWSFRFDRGVDPDDPAVMAAAEDGLAAAQADLGM